MIFKSNKFGRKLYFMIVIIIVAVFGGTYFLNNFFLSKYYIYRTKISIDNIYEQSKNESLDQFMNESKIIGEQDNLTILFIKNDYKNSSNLDSFNSEVQILLNKNKTNINRFWVNQKDLDVVNSGGYVNKIFYQGKLQSNYFAKLFEKDNYIVLIGKSMANDIETINIINTFNFYIVSVSIILSIFLVWLFTRKRVKSIEDLKNQANNIGNLKFDSKEIKTGDEIEELSKTINTMSKSLEKAHKDLENKNKELKELISNISHEVKTPLSLIKAYATGVKDGLDDGSFGDIIIEEVDNTSKLVGDLLELSKIQRGEAKKELFYIVEFLDNILEKFNIQIENKGLKLLKNYNGLEDEAVLADKEQIKIGIDNLISNSIKYNDGDYLKVELKKVKDKTILSIKNKSDIVTESELEHLWKPFYVIEKSRSKDLSGTGIGLSIVESIFKKNNLEYGISLNNKEVEFYIEF